MKESPPLEFADCIRVDAEMQRSKDAALRLCISASLDLSFQRKGEALFAAHQFYRRIDPDVISLNYLKPGDESRSRIQFDDCEIVGNIILELIGRHVHARQAVDLAGPNDFLRHGRD